MTTGLRSTWYLLMSLSLQKLLRWKASTYGVAPTSALPKTNGFGGAFKIGDCSNRRVGMLFGADRQALSCAVGSIVVSPGSVSKPPFAFGSNLICRRLGFFFVANQQLTQARPLYEKALVIAPSSYHARFNLAELELLENRPEQALSDFRQTEDDSFRLAGQTKAEYSLGHLDASRRVLD